MTDCLALKAAEEHYNAAIQASKAADYVVALQYLQKAAFLAPKESKIYALKASIYTEMCNYQSAIASHRSFFSLEQNPNKEQKLRLALLLDIQAFDLLQLCQQLNVAKLREESGEDRVIIAEEHWPLRHYTSMITTAIAYLTECVDSNAFEESFWFHRALAYIMMDQMEKALADASHCIHLNQNNVEYLVLRFKILWQMKDHDKAAEDLSRAEMINPLHCQLSSHQIKIKRELQNLYDIASKFVLLEQYEDATQVLTKAIAMNNSDFQLYMMRAAAYRDLGNPRDALRDIEFAIKLVAEEMQSTELRRISTGKEDLRLSSIKEKLHELNALRSRILIALANTLLQNRKFREALTFFNQATTNEEQPAGSEHGEKFGHQYFISRGDAYRGLNNFDAAYADYRKALDMSLDTQEIKARMAITHHYFGTQSFNKARFAEAEIEFGKAIEFDPFVSMYHVRKGDSARYLQKHLQAYNEYREALRLDPSNRKIMDKLQPYLMANLGSMDKT